MIASLIARPMTISPALLAKADAMLRDQLERTSPGTNRALPVLFALTVPPVVNQADSNEQATRAAEWSRTFDRASTDFVGALEGAGARHIERFWINSSVAAVVPREALDALARRDDVKQLILVVDRDIML